MTWLAPWALAAGALGMFGVLAAHLLSRQRPRALVLATTRFLPSGMLEATTIQPVPMDRWWMLLRLLIIALLALGLAQPVRTGATVATRTVLLLDRTLPAPEQQRVVAMLAPTDAVIAYDSMTTLVAPDASARTVARVSSLSAALGRLVRARDSLVRGADALRVVVASRFAAASLDPAAASVRALLPDSIAVLPVSAPSTPAVLRGALLVHADPDDAIAATAQVLGDSIAARGTVIQRGAALTAADSAAARAGGTVVWWPARPARGVPALQAITVRRTTWIAAMARDTQPQPLAIDGVAAGWWADGTVAVTRQLLGDGCVLRVAAALPDAGDQTLSLAAQAWLAALVTSCDADARGVQRAPEWITRGARAFATTRSMSTQTSTIAPWLVAAALLLAATELLLRLRGSAR